MARGSFGVLRLAAARPNFIDHTNCSHPIMWGEHCGGVIIVYIIIYICMSFVSCYSIVIQVSRDIYMYIYTYIHICIYIYIYVCVCLCVCHVPYFREVHDCLQDFQITILWSGCWLNSFPYTFKRLQSSVTFWGRKSITIASFWMGLHKKSQDLDPTQI